MDDKLHPTGGCSRHGSDRRAVEGSRTAHRRAAATARWTRTALAQQPGGVERHRVDLAHGRPMARLAGAIPPYQTCHRRFQRWVRDGTFERVLEALARDLKERGKLDLSECFIDGTFVVAKQGAAAWERPSGAKVRNSWQWRRWQTVLVFLSPRVPPRLRLTRLPWSPPPSTPGS